MLYIVLGVANDSRLIAAMDVVKVSQISVSIVLQTKNCCTWVAVCVFHVYARITAALAIHACTVKTCEGPCHGRI